MYLNMDVNYKNIQNVKYMVNKKKFIDDLSKRLDCDTDKCNIIKLENNFIIGKKNKDKI